jgi:diguanylate cyclase (GGDEF)-like protein
LLSFTATTAVSVFGRGTSHIPLPFAEKLSIKPTLMWDGDDARSFCVAAVISMRGSAGPNSTADFPLIGAVLDSAPQGFSVWDHDYQLIVCNRAYLDIYGFARADVSPGMSLAAVSELTIRLGNYPDTTPEQMLALYHERLQAARRSKTPVRSQKPVRGRVIATTHTYLASIGWVVMHEDVTEQTEQKRMNELAEKSLDTQNRRFSAALENMSHGLAIFDAELRIVTCNKRYLEIYRLPADIVGPGTPLLRIAELRVAAGTAPTELPDFVAYVRTATSPPERFVQTSQLANGRFIQITRSPVNDGGFVAVHQDITEEIAHLDALKASHEEIAVQKMRFEGAIANISHGLSMYDAEGRLVISNERYQQIYDAPDEFCRPGMLYTDITALRDAPTGFKRIPKSDEFVEAVLGEASSDNETIEAYRLGDGRVVSIRHSKLADGGFVRTHQDITTQVQRFETLKRAERGAARQNRVLKKQNERFDAAINNMSQGLCMFDRHERLVVCNERYAHLYNLPHELMEPGTTLSQIMAHRFSHGMVPKMGKEAYLARRKRLITDAAEAKDEIELEDGRTIFVHHRPMKGGGWVATHEDVTEQRRMEERVRHLARHDALTDLPNRAYLREQMDKIGKRIRRNEKVAVLCLDLDHFKAVNDTLGHAVGDQVLIEVAARLRQISRGNDLAARLGGDEFALIIQFVEDSREAAAIAARVVKLMAEPMEVDGHRIHIGTSVGIALAPSDGQEVESLLKNADTALYRAKSDGRGNYHFFERSMDDSLQYRRMLEHGLRGALARHELRLMYQPLVDLKTNRICCFEALLRWDHPEHGTISPTKFIPVAEETGLISSIGKWVLDEACKAAAKWPKDVRIAVNLSPAQFKQRGLFDYVISALDEAGLRAQRLELEVTESLLLAETDATLQTLHRLHELGVRISMDDFGTGYSSLSYLRSFPFDKIKIDRTFVAGLKPGDESAAIIRAVVGLGHSLGMSITAEGIETEAELEVVREQGCDEVQGFLFSPPLPASGVAVLVGTEQASRNRNRARKKA